MTIEDKKVYDDLYEVWYAGDVSETTFKVLCNRLQGYENRPFPVEMDFESSKIAGLSLLEERRILRDEFGHSVIEKAIPYI